MKQKNRHEPQDAALPIIPLWIGGRAYLTITDAFVTVQRATDGAALRRIPLCAAREVETAIRTAQSALLSWPALPSNQRYHFLAGMADALSDYAGHIADLIREETGIALRDACSEVSAAIDALHTKKAADAEKNIAPENLKTPVIAVACDASPRPLTDFLHHAMPAWQSGAVIIARISADAPSVFFAFAELTAYCRWPAGVFNLLYGDISTDAALKAAACPVIYTERPKLQTEHPV